jgi:hypothetical protein
MELTLHKMKMLIALLLLPGILLVCVVGCAAALCRYRRLDDWCARQLTDADEDVNHDE